MRAAASPLLALGLTVGLSLGAACGGKDAPASPDGGGGSADAPACQPISAIGAFYRRTPNPRLVAGHHTYQDGGVDVAIADPDLRWDEAGQSWQLYYHGPHAMTFADPPTQMIRHATSPDLASWTIDDAPALAASADAAAWDHVNTEAPTVVYNPDAPADRRYLLMYSGASGTFPYPGYTFPGYGIGAAFSADGKTFTRVPASESPHGADGLVLTGADAYPGTTGAIVADPELAYVAGTYHLWFSSFACIGTTCETVADHGIGHATSTDGIHWTVTQAPVPSLLRASADPTSGGAQPSVIYDDVHCRWEMWLASDAAGETDAQPIAFDNMAGVWHATSTDGASWTVNYLGTRDLTWMSAADGEHLGLRTGADVAAKSSGRYLVYTGIDDQNVPSGAVLPARAGGDASAVTTLNLAARDAP